MLICKRTMRPCPTEGMCAPFQGCSSPPADGIGSGFFDLPRPAICNDPAHLAPSHLYIPPGRGYRHVCPACGAVQILAPQVTCNKHHPTR